MTGDALGRPFKTWSNDGLASSIAVDARCSSLLRRGPTDSAKMTREAARPKEGHPNGNRTAECQKAPTRSEAPRTRHQEVSNARSTR
jgi:hypothetical protein